MDILTFNAAWMLWNLFLACIPLVCIFIYSRTTWSWLKVFLAIIWLAFLPNTLYIITDLYHLTYEWYLVQGSVTKFFLVVQFALFIPTGFITYKLSTSWFADERVKWAQYFKKNSFIAWLLRSDISIYLLHLLVSFGIVLGRVERTNSWDLVQRPGRVVMDIMNLLTSPYKVLWIVVLWFIMVKVFSSHFANKKS